MRIFLFFLLLLVMSMGPTVAFAASTVEEDLKAMREQFAGMQAKLQALEDKVDRQEAQIAADRSAKQAYEHRIADLEEQLSAHSADVAVQPAPNAPSRPVPGKWTPEIGVVADTVVKLDSSKEDEGGNNRLSLRELELVVGSNVDPFSRLDATVAFSDSEGPDLEEAYLTRFGLPFNTTARIGELKPRIGKTLGVHMDSLETVDEPLVIRRYFGAEGMHKAGLELNQTLDLPLPVTQQVVYGVMEGGNGDGGTAFGTRRSAPTLYAHVKNYKDLTDTTGLELGVSYMAGSKDDAANFNSRILGGDLTLTQYLNANQALRLQGEVFNLDRKKTVDAEGSLWGAYGLLDFRFHPQWSMGARYDYAELVDNPVENPRKADYGETGYLTFVQSEFARWRLQYEYTRLASGKDNNTVFLQGTFAIGDHKHKLQ